MDCEQDKKLVKSKAGLKIVARRSDSSSPFILCEPSWIPDKECPRCMKCEAKFDMMNRRHHCRRCGQCFCSSCTSNKAALHRMCFVDPVRQCAACALLSQHENDFFDKHLPTLTTGASFLVTNEAISDIPCFCRLSPDHRFLTLTPSRNATALNAVYMEDVEGVQILTSGTDSQGPIVPSGTTLKYRDEDTFKVVRLVADQNVPDRRQSVQWIVALQRAFKIIYEGRLSEANSPCTPPGPS